MSFLTENGITMASDSKVTYFPDFRVDNNLDFKKTNYYDDLKFGLSIWGKLKIKKVWFWKWFDNIKKSYFETIDKKISMSHFITICFLFFNLISSSKIFKRKF